MPPPSPEWAGHLAYFHPRILAVEELLVDRAWSSRRCRMYLAARQGLVPLDADRRLRPARDLMRRVAFNQAHNRTRRARAVAAR